jgi:hypothetical protein
MVTIESARIAALSLPETETKSHFNIPDFRINNKIFASLHTDKRYMMIKLSPVDQSVFCSWGKGAVFPVPGGWGRSGATFFDLRKIKKAMLYDALACAWKITAPVKLVKRYFPEK